jgi:hypothetical protein
MFCQKKPDTIFASNFVPAGRAGIDACQGRRMSPDDFIRQVSGLYLKQKKRKNTGPGTYRGTSPSASWAGPNNFFEGDLCL